ncbi:MULTISPECIES: branched-chain amino acid ABC transporter permease [unclassified Microbacterium]|uniref:branched-chain amino acid ABC transporter permease n=1 Tax=unclassified Microbacterium TaxID=2609290 RepID=UPI0004183729|nr:MULTISPECIES: branched-chain amino acid ABC transporter permease [unclassified Microbacterium]AXA97172.1 branched-chain amino acid ABC transporter permease [Microbacterium sp. PM5]MDC7803510.1 branched-chain amino acid ABC transporter permease [Sphingomonas sp. BLCC-B65]
MDFWITLLQQLTETAIAPITAAYVIAAIGLNIHFGYTGLMNMGQAGFMLLGAYGFAITVINGGGFWLGVLVAIVACVVFAFVLGIPTLRLRGDYLAIVTICAAEIVRMVGRLSALADVTGGSTGLVGPEYRGAFTSLSILPPGTTQILWFSYPNTDPGSGNDWWTRLVAWTLVAIALLFTWLAMRSPWGRVLKGIREDEDAVRSLGKSSYSYKMQALIIGGVLGGIAGILVVLPASVQPDGFGRPLTFNLWTIMLLGGAATIFGPLLGSIIFFVVRIAIVQIAGEYIPASILNTQQTQWLSWVLIGIALMLLVIFRPQGILGNKKELSFNA